MKLLHNHRKVVGANIKRTEPYGIPISNFRCNVYIDVQVKHQQTL